jgi:hypothetical protein
MKIMRNVVAVLSVAALTLCTGCASMVVKRGLAEVRGAKAELYPLKTIPASVSRSASAIRVGTVESDGAGAAEFRSALQMGLTKAIEKAKVSSGSGSPLTIRAVVRFYEGKGASKLMGGTAFGIARVEVLDEQNNVIGKADALASTEALRTSGEALAEAMGKEIIEWVTRGRKEPK